jgi:hypothetical protein
VAAGPGQRLLRQQQFRVLQQFFKWLAAEEGIPSPVSGDLMELNGWSSLQMLRRYRPSVRAARARRTYDRIMEDGR